MALGLEFDSSSASSSSSSSSSLAAVAGTVFGFLAGQSGTVGGEFPLGDEKADGFCCSGRAGLFLARVRGGGCAEGVGGVGGEDAGAGEAKGEGVEGVDGGLGGAEDLVVVF